MGDRRRRSWKGLRAEIRIPTARGCTVTFDYGERGYRTLVAPSRRAAFEDAVTRWGADWIGEPCISTPDSIFNDLTGWTKREHGQDFTTPLHNWRQQRRIARTGRASK